MPGKGGQTLGSLKEASHTMNVDPPQNICPQPKGKEIDATDATDATNATNGTNGTNEGHAFFREDDRDFDELNAKGFEAWVQLELTDVRRVATRFNGKSTGPLRLAEEKAEWLGKWIEGKKLVRKGVWEDIIQKDQSRGGKDLVDAKTGQKVPRGSWVDKTLKPSDMGNCIKFKVDRSSIQNSTGITEEGGGRGKKHLYKITIPKPLYSVDPTRRTHQKDPESFKVIARSKLVMDDPDIMKAKVIGIAIVGGEVAFLTSLPKSWITQVK